MTPGPPTPPSRRNGQPLIPLALRAQSGDQTAIDELAEHLLPIVRITAGTQLDAKLRRSLEEEDLVQIAMLAIHEELPRMKVRSEPEFLTWARTIVLHRLRDQADHWKAAKRDPGRGTSLDDLTGADDGSASEGLRTQDGGVVEEVAGRELIALMIETISGLPPDHAETLRLIDFEGWSVRDVASLLGISKSAVRYRHAQARATLSFRLGYATRSRTER